LPEFERGIDAGSWRRFSKEMRYSRTVIETIVAAPASRSKARYFYGSDGYTAAAVNALVTYGAGAGPMPAHANAELVAAFVDEFWSECDADGRLDFGGLIALAFLECIVAGESFVLFVQREEGLRLRLIPAEQVDESLTRDLGGGAHITAGIEFNAQGERVGYWIRPFAPNQQFETWAPPVRVDAADVLHLMRPVGVGQVRGISWLAPIMLKLADLGLLSDSLLKGFQVAALHAGFIEDSLGTSGLPFDGQSTDNPGELEVSLEPGTVRRLGPGQKITFNNPQAAQQSIEFQTSQIEAISAGLSVPAFMTSGCVSRANYSSLRAALITFKAHLEAIQFNVLVPQLLNPIWRRFVLTESLRNGRATTDADMRCEWRFPAMPEADPIKQVQATVAQLNARLMSRREAVAARGESIERVDADIAADPFTTDPEESDDEA
jgi:lambda family phage portal protein